MNADNWYRNKIWDAQIEQDFNKKLDRARLKQDYLRIQASYLTSTDAEVALDLLDRYFEIGIHFDMAQAWFERGNAYATLGEIEMALSAYFEALYEEDLSPQVKTQAYLELPKLVANAEVAAWYPRALEILERYAGKCTTARDNYEWNAANALILSKHGPRSEARKYAKEAVQIAHEQAFKVSYQPKNRVGGAVYAVRNDDWHKDFYKKTYAVAGYGRQGLKGIFSQMFGH